MINLKRCFLLFFVVSLTGCSNPLDTHFTNIKLAILLNKDASITLEEVKASKVELALIKSGSRPVALIAKAFDENDKAKWISQDKAMLVIKDGRVIRTVGFLNDQLGIYSGTQDPLVDPLSIDGKTWSRLIDWSIGEYGYASESIFEIGSEKLSVFGHTFETLYVTEKVVQPESNSLFLSTDNWTNEFWFDKSTGKLLQSYQKASSASDKFEIQFVSNIASLVKG